MPPEDDLFARVRAARDGVRALDARTSSRCWVPHRPTPKQAEFLACDELEALYGGAAGGGKSDALLMAALQYVHVPGYAALILRRTYPDLALPGAIMDRAIAWLRPLGVHWDETDKRFTFPSGATLTFGYCNKEKDRFRYQGSEFQFIGIDELTQWPLRWYLYLLSRLRRLAGAMVPLRARAGSNPGGIGHDWVFKRFVEGAQTDKKRPFVPALLSDNPHLDADAYREALAELDPTTRLQLEFGRWVRDTGTLVYSSFEPARNLIIEAPALNHHILGMDYGVTNATSFNVLGWRDHDPCVYVVKSYKKRGMSPSEAGKEALELEETFSFDRVVGDLGGLGKGFAVEGRRRYRVPIEAADKNNKLGYIKLFNGDLADARIKLVEDETRELVEEWLKLPWTEDRQKEAPGFENHCSDGTLYGWRATSAYAEEPEQQKLKAGTPEAYRAEEEAMLERRIREVTAPQRDWWDV